MKRHYLLVALCAGISVAIIQSTEVETVPTRAERSERRYYGHRRHRHTDRPELTCEALYQRRLKKCQEKSSKQFCEEKYQNFVQRCEERRRKKAARGQYRKGDHRGRRYYKRGMRNYPEHPSYQPHMETTGEISAMPYVAEDINPASIPSPAPYEAESINPAALTPVSE